MPFLETNIRRLQITIYKLIVLSFIFLLFIPFPQIPQFNNVNETLCIEAMWNNGDIISLVIQSGLKYLSYKLQLSSDFNSDCIQSCFI